MTKSLKHDIQLLISIRSQQTKIIQVLKDFKCNSNNLVTNTYAFDLCAMYIAQLGEASKLLTDTSKEDLRCINPNMMRYFRNIIDHVYEKINKQYLVAYIFNTISEGALQEVNNRIRYCQQNAR